MRSSARRPWLVLVVWALITMLGAGIAIALLGNSITTEFTFTNRPESKRAEDLLQSRLRGPRPVEEIVVVHSGDLSVDDAAVRQTVETIYSDILALGPDIISRGVQYYQSRDPSLVSEDRHTTIIPFAMAGGFDKAGKNIHLVHEALAKVERRSGVQVMITGAATIGKDFQDIAQEDLREGETFGAIAAIGILVLVFGAVVAAMVPLLLAVVSIVLALGMAALVGQGFHLVFFVTNMIVMIGLAVGIDYCLFILHRYREERGGGLPRLEAITEAGNTAGRAVLFSGTTVVVALTGLLIVPTNVYRSLGIGAILVVIASVAASLTLLPAILSILGDGVNRLSLPFSQGIGRARHEEKQGFWDTAVRSVMGRPLLSLALAGGLLIAAAIPYLSIKTGAAGVETFPDHMESKQAILALQKDFSVGLLAPVEIVIDGPISSQPVQEALKRLTDALGADPAFGPPAPVQVNTGSDLALLSVPLAHEIEARAAAKEAKRLREHLIPAAFAGVPGTAVLVGGEPALNLDFFRIADGAVLPVFGFVLGMSFLLLMVAFRSVVVPLKATALNLLSVGAAYGILVLVFSKGFLSGLFGFQRVDIIEAWLPLFLFTVLFGLSMDYHVFLLSRIRERFGETADNQGSVAFGIRSTGRLITGAALITVAVFAGFASGSLMPIQQIGLGLAVAILVDATIVRMVLVPAGMKLLGRANWYLPGWLSWLPDVGVEVRQGKSAVAPASGIPERA